MWKNFRKKRYKKRTGQSTVIQVGGGKWTYVHHRPESPHIHAETLWPPVHCPCSRQLFIAPPPALLMARKIAYKLCACANNRPLPPKDPGKSSNAHWHGGEADDGRRWHRELCQAGQGILVGWRWSTGVGLWRYGIAKTYCVSVVSNPRVEMTPKQNGFCWIMFFFYFSLSKLLTRYALSIMWWGRWWELSLLIHVRTVYLVCRYCSCQRRQLCL